MEPACQVDRRSTVSEVGLAWAFASAADPYLTTCERHVVYVAIGGGETLAAITLLLTVIAEQRLALQSDVLTAFIRWLDAYAHHDHEPHLRELFRRIVTGPKGQDVLGRPIAT